MVNGDRLESEQALSDGDLVAIGSSRLLFQLGEAAEAPVSRPAKGAEVRCSLCGKKANSTDRFCRGCGKDLATLKQSVVCGSCGIVVGLPADFCGNCGKALAKLPREGQATRPHRLSDLLGSPKPDEEAGSNREAPAELPIRRPPPPRRKPATGSGGEPAGFGRPSRLCSRRHDDSRRSSDPRRVTVGHFFYAYCATAYAIGPDTRWLLAPVSVLLRLLWGGRGATQGKSLLGLTVRTKDGVVPIGYGRAALRVLGYLVSSLPFCLGFLWIAFSEDKRGLHDFIAGTRVTRSA
jgi:hypothetical protein